MTKFLLVLPLPPTINSYWGFSGHRRFLTLQAREFKTQVAHIVSQQKTRFGKAPIVLVVTIHFRDRRIQDLSNRIKALEDAMVQSGLLFDDSQIKEIHVYEGEIVKGGKMVVQISLLS